MVETLVAFLLLVIGVIATLQVLDASRRTGFRAEESQAMNNVGQRELEEIRALEYGQVALSGTPATSSDPTHPGSRVAGISPNGTFDLRDGSSPASVVQNGGIRAGGGTLAGGEVAPSEDFTEGDISGTIYRYVVWQDDPGCVLCAGTQDFKRVIVAVKITQAANATFSRNYQEFQTDVVDPDAGPLTSGSGDPGNLTTAQQFWLSDQLCVGTGEPPPANPTDSPTNDTTSTCTSGSAPDALVSEAPPDPEPDNPDVPAIADYADDLEPDGVTSGSDKGLQMLSQEANGCNPSPGGTDAKKRIHWWSTKRLEVGSAGSGDTFAMTGDSTLELWTRTIDDAQASGAVCIYLRERPVNLLFLELDREPIPLAEISSPTAGFSCSVFDAANGVGRCSTATWPSGAWRKLRISLGSEPDFGLGLYSRIEVGISVDPDGTTSAEGDPDSNVLQFLYDHPTFDSRFEVITTTPL